jgi:hypothetical protein
MGNMVLTLVIDVMMAALLLITLFYCSRLNKRIRLLQDAKSELAHIVQEFDESTQRATQSIADIHAASTRISENIQHKIDKANFLADDLQFLIERSAKITDKNDVPASNNARNAAATRSSAAEVPRGSRGQSPTAEAMAARQAASEAGASSGSDADKRRAGLRMRSKAEQELLDALKSNE